MDSLPNEILNEVSEYMSLEEYIDFIEANPRACDSMVLRRKMEEEKRGYSYEIIYHDLVNNENGFIAEYRAGKIRITIKRIVIEYYPAVEDGKDDEITYVCDVDLYYGDIISLRLGFSYDDSDIDPYALTKDSIYLEGAYVKPKINRRREKTSRTNGKGRQGIWLVVS